MKGFFERVVCVNLARRPERWAMFQQRLAETEWPFADVERFNAVDGRKTGVPDWWKARLGVWGCFRSHLRLLEDALNEGLASLLILEDDAIFTKEFANRAASFLKALPADWDQAYLGGKLVGRASRIDDLVMRVNGVILTHAYAVNGPFLYTLYKHLCSIYVDHTDQQVWDVDECMAQLHRDPACHIYCPTTWLIRQTGRRSDVR